MLQSLLDDDVTMTLAALTSSSNIHVADAVSVINEKSEFAVQTLQSLVEDDQTISTPNFQIIDDQPIVYSALDIESNGITPIIGSNNDFIANDNVSMSMTAALWNPILVRAEEQTEVDVVAAHIDHPVWLPSISAQLTSFESQPVHQMTCVRPQVCGLLQNINKYLCLYYIMKFHLFCVFSASSLRRIIYDSRSYVCSRFNSSTVIVQASVLLYVLGIIT